MAFSMSINGTDITPYIKNGGVKWSRNDVDGPNAGRLMTGEMVRDYIATKVRFDIACIPLTQSQLSMMLTLLKQHDNEGFLSVQYTDPETNTTMTGRFYTNNFSVEVRLRKANGIEYWDGLSFPLVER